MAPDMRNKSAMTVGQVGAGSTAVEPKAAFASAPGGLVPNPKSELEFVEPAQVNGEPFSFHFRAKSDRVFVDLELLEGETNRYGGAFGTGQDE